MGKHKILENVAEHIGTSFLSAMNYIDGDYTFKRIYELAKDKKEPYIEIDLMRQNVRPDSMAAHDIQASVGYYTKILASLLEAQGLTRDDISDAKIRISFDLEKSISSHDSIHPVFECSVEIEDLDGIKHRKRIHEWYKW